MGQQLQQQQQQQQSAGVSAARAPTTLSGPDAAAQHSQLEQQKQNRLLQLLHAGDCQTPIGGGCAAPNCELFKQSLPHYMSCQDATCTQRHCASSRFCLMHWAGCADPRCEVCPGVNREFSRSERAQATRKALLAQQPAGINGGNGQYAGVKRAASAGGSDATGGSADYKRLRVDAPAPTYSQVVAGIRAGTVPEMSAAQWDELPVEQQQAWYQRVVRDYERRQQQQQMLLQSQQQAMLVSRAGPASSGARDVAMAAPVRPASKARIDGNCTLIATMGKVDILRHLTSLREDCNTIVSPEQIRHEMGEILNRIFDQVCG